VVVTGGSAGVGRATVRAFAERGDHVAILARDHDGLEAAAKEVESAGSRALALPVDVADAAAVDAAASSIEEQLGPIDVWVNNAMTSVFAPFTEVEPDEIKRVTEVNYLGFVYGTKAALSRMLPRDHGVIIQVGSALAYRGIPLQAAYCGSKHAIKGFTESVRTELLHEKSGVRITMVQMPALNTPQFDWVLSRLPKKPQPVPPIFQPEVAARGIVWAAEHKRSEVWVGGSTVLTILGNHAIPRLLDRYLARTGYKSQQTDQPADPRRRANVWGPVDGDHGAHGDFDAKAKDRSYQWWLTTHRTPVLGALGALGAAAALRATRRNGH
jgi:NAD(P)-dependent dehydrogenase (short-subunit alcohol dehydrogenase family)